MCVYVRPAHVHTEDAHTHILPCQPVRNQLTRMRAGGMGGWMDGWMDGWMGVYCREGWFADDCATRAGDGWVYPALWAVESPIKPDPSGNLIVNKAEIQTNNTGSTSMGGHYDLEWCGISTVDLQGSRQTQIDLDLMFVDSSPRAWPG